MKRINRREFLQWGVTSVGAISAFPWLARAARGANLQKKALVVVFQRGAVDGLSMFPPLGDSHYHEYRPTIAIPEKGEDSIIPLQAQFGLHPSLSDLKPLWDERLLAVVHQVGSSDPTRSHFDAQDYVETGVPGKKNVEDGFLNRAMQTIPQRTTSALRAISIGNDLPRSLWGSVTATAMPSVEAFAKAGWLNSGKNGGDFEAMYRHAVDQTFRGAGQEAFNALHTLKAVQERSGTSADGSSAYPDHPLGKKLKDVALLIKSDVGVQVAAVDCGGWDTHANQGAGSGQLAKNLKGFGESIAAFARDLGPQLDDVVLVTVTEFGRTARENGTKGTDHGHGSVMLVMGGSVGGKRFLTDFKGLSPDHLFENRDLPVTFDHRDVFSEVLSHHLAVPDLKRVFPGFTRRKLQLFRA